MCNEPEAETVTPEPERMIVSTDVPLSLVTETRRANSRA